MTIKRPIQQKIAARAYQLYVERGRQDGHDVDDWLQAEYELLELPVSKLAELEPNTVKTTKSTPRQRNIVEVVRAAMML